MISDDDDWHDPDDYDPEADCEHEHYEIDVCTGRAECDYCSHSWYLTSEEIDAELDRQARYYEDMERENRRQWWRDLFAPIIDPINSLRWKLRRMRWRWQRSPVIDDEIPF